MGAVSLHKIDFKKFLQAIDLCKGDVFQMCIRDRTIGDCGGKLYLR